MSSASSSRREAVAERVAFQRPNLVARVLAGDYVAFGEPWFLPESPRHQRGLIQEHHLRNLLG